jgi:hypothetical protein
MTGCQLVASPRCAEIRLASRRIEDLVRYNSLMYCGPRIYLTEAYTPTYASLQARLKRIR